MAVHKITVRDILEVDEICERIAEFIPGVDAKTQTQRSSRSGSGAYIPCVGTIWEDDLTREVATEWFSNRPGDLPGFTTDWLEVRYPRHRRGNCDLCLIGNGYRGGPPFEWAIEMKYVRFIGDNGKNNDYGVTKVASPYRKDRSSVLDAERLLEFDLASRKAVIMYGFEFDSDSIDLAIDWCDNISPDAERKKNFERAKNMKSVLDKEDPQNHLMELVSLIPLFEAACRTRGIDLSDVSQHTFDGLNRHPLYAKGRVMGWEVIDGKMVDCIGNPIL